MATVRLPTSLEPAWTSRKFLCAMPSFSRSFQKSPQEIQKTYGSFSIDPRSELQKMERMLMRRIASLAIARAKASTPFSAMSRRPLDCRLLSSSSSSSSSLTRVVSGSAAKVSDVSEEDDDLVYANPPASSVVKPVLPDILQPGVVIYDGVCHLCHRGVKWVIGVDKYRHIKFCCLQSKAAEPYLRVSGLDREDVLRRFLFVEGPGLYHQGSTAALRVLSYLPFPYSALSSLLIIPTPLRDAVYDYVAKRRYDWFGKAEGCLVLQEKDLLERFIDREELMDQPDF